MSSSTGAGDPPVAIYSVCDARFFLGLVALINSLRLHGHREPVSVVDCGLEEWQRERLSKEATIVEAPKGLPPYLLKYVGPSTRPADAMILLDADIIVTKPLGALVSEAASGKIVAFVDRLPDRFFPEWQTLLDLPPLRRQPYVNSGFLFLPRRRGLELLSSLQTGQRRIDVSQTFLGGADPNYPFFILDQDVLNAVLCAETQPNELALVDYELAPHPPFDRLTELDLTGVTCSYSSGVRPYGLHHVLKEKPWLTIRRPSVYSRLLARLWVAEDLAIRLTPKEIPPAFRNGLFASAARVGAYTYGDVQSLRGRVGSRLRSHGNGHEQPPTDARLRSRTWSSDVAEVAVCDDD